MAKQRLFETPAEEAHSLGLEYGGFGGWIDPKTRAVKAKTIDGHLVKVNGNEQGGDEEPEYGPLVVLHMENWIYSADPDAPFTQKYNKMIKTIVHKGIDVAVLVERGKEHVAADYLRKMGIGAGVKLVPINAEDDTQVKEFFRQKIDLGYRKFHYFDSNHRNIKAVESLKAPYNKLDLKLRIHYLTPKGAEGFQTQ
jgi:hypothetical protein